VFPDVAEGMDEYTPVNQQTVRLVFQGAEATAKPLITSMAIDCKIAANILSATTRTLDGKIYGNMLLSIPGGPDELATAVKYLSKAQSVTVQVDVEYAASRDDQTEGVSSDE
jgi:D-methionine transport system ATP-binding protein